MNPNSQENDVRTPVSCKSRYFKSVKTSRRSTASEFFTGDEVRGPMGHPFLHPKAKELLGRVAHSFESENLFVSINSHVIFVCGGTAENCARFRFLEYAKIELPQFRLFLAEVALKDLTTHDDGEFHNIATFEELIGEIAECIILFPESAGSYAELGYFAKNEKIRRSLLVVNDASLQGEDSFISIGPIELIDKYSRFRTTIQIDYEIEHPPFGLIKRRLEKRIPRRTRTAFEYKKYGDLSTREKLFVVAEIVHIFGPLTLDGVEFAVRRIFKKAGRRQLKQVLSVLVAARYVSRLGELSDLFWFKAQEFAFLEFESLDVTALRLEIRDHYLRNEPDLAQVLPELAP